MEKTEKGKSFMSLFFKDKPSPQTQNAQGTNPVSSVGSGYTPTYTPTPADSNLTEQFEDMLQKLINDNNQPGFDFVEFTESLFEASPNPGPEVYQMVYKIAQKMDKMLTSPSKLIEAANFYKNLVSQAATSKINEGNAKKATLNGEKDSERNSLQQNLDKTNKEIEQLKTRIQTLSGDATSLTNQLATIDQKYSQLFSAVDAKITAINQAKDNIVNSIVDIEAGITQNIK